MRSLGSKRERSEPHTFDEDYLEISRIKGSRETEGVTEFLVEWKAHRPDSWEPETFLHQSTYNQFLQSIGPHMSTIIDRGEFFPVKRVSVTDDSAKRAVDEARRAGMPIVVTDHCGWPQFASRWLLPKTKIIPASTYTRIEGRLEPTSNLLDLRLPYELDVEAMARDIGNEQAPILLKNYDEKRPIKHRKPIKDYLSDGWISDDKTYLHQWLFTDSPSAVELLGCQCEDLPVLNEDLLRYWYDRSQLNGDSPYQYIFMGSKGTFSKLHRDDGGLMITIAPIIGEKEVVMVHRDDGRSAMCNLDSMTECLELNEAFAVARSWRTVLVPGEILIMPQGTYHQCRNVSPCLSYHRFHLDAINLPAFFESWKNQESSKDEIDYESIIWNVSSALIDRPNPDTECIEVLRLLLVMCRRIHGHYSNGHGRGYLKRVPKLTKECPSEEEIHRQSLSREWQKLARDIEASIKTNAWS